MTANEMLIGVIGLFFVATGIIYILHLKKKEDSTKRELGVSYALIIAGVIISLLPFLSFSGASVNSDLVEREERKSKLLGQEAFTPDVQEISENYEKARVLYAKGAKLWNLETSRYDSTAEAMAYFNQSIEIYETAEALVGRGQLKMQLSKMDAAMKDYERAIVIKPEFGNAYFNRAALYYVYGDTQKACEDWRKAKELGVPQAVEVVANMCN